MLCGLNYFQILMTTLGHMQLFLIDFFNATLLALSAVVNDCILVRGHLRQSDFFFLIYNRQMRIKSHSSVPVP